MDKPTDQDILNAVASGHIMLTYVIKNKLRSKCAGLKTDFVRRRLMALEKLGKVERYPTPYASHICWAIPKEAPQ